MVFFGGKNMGKNITKAKAKKSFALILVAVMVFTFIPMGAFPLTASAATPGAGKTWIFTESSPDEKDVKYGGGTYTWVKSSKTLTLNNVNHSTNAPIALAVPTGTTIVSKGKNFIKSTFKGENANDSCGIYGGDLTIKGTGSLTVNSGNAQQFSYGLSVANLTISAGTVTVTSGTGGLSGMRGISFGIRAGKVKISGGKVTATSGVNKAGSSYGLSVGNVEISGGTVIAKGGNAVLMSDGIYTMGSVVITGGTVTATGTKSTESTSYGIAAKTDIKISGGIVTAKGDNSAFGTDLNKSREFIVPKGLKYTVSANIAGTSPVAGKSDGTFKVTASHKYAKIEGSAALKTLTLTVTSPKNSKITKRTKTVTVKVTKGAKVSISATGLKAKVKSATAASTKYTFKGLDLSKVKKGTVVKITAKKSGYKTKTIKIKI